MMPATNSTGKLCHTDVFDAGNPIAERNTRWAIGLTIVTMIAEIAGGWVFNSMALLADGWHMSSHALALGLSAFAYAAARRFSRDTRFAFGTWKIEVLAGYTSAIFLIGIAVTMLFQSVERLISPAGIRYDEAMAIAVIGLAVNLACAWLLRDSHDDRHHDSTYGDQHHDLNQRSAYLHVVTDAATSVLAIIALLFGKFMGAAWLDPVMGIAGAALVSAWAIGLMRDTGRILLDAEMDAPIVAEVRNMLNSLPPPARITDFHVWRVGRGKYACIISLDAGSARDVEEIRRRLGAHEELVHLTVETTAPTPRKTAGIC